MADITTRAKVTLIRPRAIPVALGCLILTLIACNLSTVPTSAPAQSLPTPTALLVTNPPTVT